MHRADTDTPEKKFRLITRRRAAGLIFTGVAGCLLDGFVIEPTLLSVTRQDVTCKKLPSALDGLKVCLLTDLHFLPGTNDSLLEKVIHQVRMERPDIIALGGDYMNHDPKVIQPLLEKLGKLHCTHGIFAVMGNHDGWSGNVSVIRRQFEKTGISFLVNQHSQLDIRGEKLALAGTDFVWLGKPDPTKTLKGISADTPVIALVHEPDYFDTMAAQRNIQLQLSGHTHGGQCRVPLIGYAPAKVKYGKKYIYGSYATGDSTLFVSRGVGTTSTRVRFACPPELAVLTLRESILS
jgi:predicted MPP superfamily phosphohydrolase